MMMNEQEFDRRYEAIKTRYSGHDREQALLFAESGWTQQRIADRIGVSQGWVDKQLRFGRFLELNPAGLNSRDITERQFRQYWDNTDISLLENDRFRSILRRLGLVLPEPVPPPAPPPIVVVPEPPAPVRNLAAMIEAFGREIGLTVGDRSWKKARRGQIELLFTKGTQHMRDMVARPGRRGVGLDSAYCYVRDHTLEQQDKAIYANVRGYGEKVREKQRSLTKPPAKTSKKSKPVVIPVTLPSLKLDTDVGIERIPGQPIQLHPVNVQRLQEALIRVNAIAGFAHRLATIDREQLGKDLPLLLAYRPVVGKKNGEQRDFAREARQACDTLCNALESAIDYLSGLREVLAPYQPVDKTRRNVS